MLSQSRSLEFLIVQSISYSKLYFTFWAWLDYNPSCLCLAGIEDKEHFLLHYPSFATQRRDLLELVSSMSNAEIMRLSSKELSNL